MRIVEASGRWITAWEAMRANAVLVAAAVFISEVSSVGLNYYQLTHIRTQLNDLPTNYTINSPQAMATILTPPGMMEMVGLLAIISTFLIFALSAYGHRYALDPASTNTASLHSITRLEMGRIGLFILANLTFLLLGFVIIILVSGFSFLILTMISLSLEAIHATNAYKLDPTANLGYILIFAFFIWIVFFFTSATVFPAVIDDRRFSLRDAWRRGGGLRLFARLSGAFIVIIIFFSIIFFLLQLITRPLIISSLGVTPPTQDGGSPIKLHISQISTQLAILTHPFSIVLSILEALAGIFAFFVFAATLSEHYLHQTRRLNGHTG